MAAPYSELPGAPVMGTPATVTIAPAAQAMSMNSIAAFGALPGVVIKQTTQLVNVATGACARCERGHGPDTPQRRRRRTSHGVPPRQEVACCASVPAALAARVTLSDVRACARP